MTSVKYKYLKLLFTSALALLFIAGAPTLLGGHVSADPQIICGKGATKHTNTDGAYCSCPGSQVVDETDSNNCKNKCPANTKQNTITKNDGGKQIVCVAKASTTGGGTGNTTNGCNGTDSNTSCIDTACAADNTTCADPAASCDTQSGGQCDFIGKYINPAINLLSVIFGILMVISLIIGGISYSTSEGDPQKAGKAKRRIANTIIAVVAYVFLYAFLQFIVPGGLFNK